MKQTLTITRKSDGKVFIRNFKSKKEMRRWMGNNWIDYTW